MKAEEAPLDVITFSGNGEPTLHPDFAGVVDDTIALRDKYFPQARVSVLSNSTRIYRPEIIEALKKVDNNILKLDSAFDATIKALDRPTSPDFTAARTIQQLKTFANRCIIQTMILRGDDGDTHIDNTTDAEVDALIEAYKAINPREIMIYSIDRKTPARWLRKVEKPELERIADRIRSHGFKVDVA